MNKIDYRCPICNNIYSKRAFGNKVTELTCSKQKLHPYAKLDVMIMSGKLLNAHFDLHKCGELCIHFSENTYELWVYKDEAITYISEFEIPKDMNIFNYNKTKRFLKSLVELQVFL